jgi:hypothetical protein
MVLFAIAALLGFVIGGTTAYSDGTVWGDRFGGAGRDVVLRRA